MMVSARKNVKVDGIQINKHDEGVLRGVQHCPELSHDDFYLVEFKDYGLLKVHKSDFDILNFG